MTDELIHIMQAYDFSAARFESLTIDHPNLDGRKLQRVKEFSFYLRDWIRDYSTKIFPTHAINIPLGSVNDNPQQLGNIFRD